MIRPDLARRSIPAAAAGEDNTSVGLGAGELRNILAVAEGRSSEADSLGCSPDCTLGCSSLAKRRGRDRRRGWAGGRRVEGFPVQVC